MAASRRAARRRRAARAALSVLGLLLLVPLAINAWVVGATAERIVNHPALLAARDVALVLGTSRFTRAGHRNALFADRIQTAVRLFDVGAVEHILVSGANPDKSYNEPRAMYLALRELGVPRAAITLDFAGFRTLDSVVRAARVFGVERPVIISQRYHDYRALFIARYYGIDAVAYVPPTARHAQSLRTEAREYFARVKACLDLYLFATRPRYLGPARPIGRAPPSFLRRLLFGEHGPESAS